MFGREETSFCTCPFLGLLYLFMYVHVHMYIHLCINVCIYKYTCIYVHTHASEHTCTDGITLWKQQSGIVIPQGFQPTNNKIKKDAPTPSSAAVTGVALEAVGGGGAIMQSSARGGEEGGVGRVGSGGGGGGQVRVSNERVCELHQWLTQLKDWLDTGCMEPDVYAYARIKIDKELASL